MAADDRPPRGCGGPSEELHVLRPEYVVLEEETLVPATNIVRPVPDHFTHKLVVDQPYRLDRPRPDSDPDGVLPAGTPVLLLFSGGEDRCRVATASGLAVDVPCASLQELRRGSIGDVAPPES